MSDQDKKETEAVLAEKMDEVRAQAGQDMDIKIDEAPFAAPYCEAILVEVI